MSARRLRRLVLLVGGLLLCSSLAGCLTLYRYTVSLIPLEDCIIRPNGEFCDEEESLPPPASEVWAVRLEEEHTIVYAGNETWIADGVEGERRSIKEEKTSRNSCTTTVTRTLIFDEDGQTLTGTLERKTRVEGPESCGDAPFGDRQRYDLLGETGAIL